MNRPLLDNTFGAAVPTAGVMAAAVPAAHADSMTPGWDDIFVIDSCAFPFRSTNRHEVQGDQASPRGQGPPGRENARLCQPRHRQDLACHRRRDQLLARPSGRLGHPDHRRSLGPPPVRCTPSTPATGPASSPAASPAPSPPKPRERPSTSASSAAQAHDSLKLEEVVMRRVVPLAFMLWLALVAACSDSSAPSK